MEIKAGQAITKFVFKIDGCLLVSERAGDMETARMRAERMWPRSTVEFISEEFSHFAEDRSRLVAPITEGLSVKRGVVSRKKDAGSKKDNFDMVSVEDRMTRTVADAFAGV